VLEQERLRGLVEGLRSDETIRDATKQLLEAGPAAEPVLLRALERRELDIRVRAAELLKHILGGVLPFDPYASEEVRRRQLGLLREFYERRAG
jgi:hypothetical protein